jgi:hypothetical protein
MKRIIALMMLAVMLISTAWAESLVYDEYTDVPTVMTQDSVLELTANENCLIETLQPDEESIALLDSVYHFVWDEGNRPARYYDVVTQQKISELAGGIDIDILHMTEAMRLQLTGAPEKLVTATMELDVEYYVGQLIIVVLGIPQGEGEYIWYPYRGRVETMGQIKWDIPVGEWNELCKQPISFHVLTDRVGPRGERIWHEKKYKDRIDIFSKDSHDVIKTRRWYTETGKVIEDDFRVWLVDLTAKMQEEVLRIGEHVADGKPILDYFPAERKAEGLLMLPVNVDPAALVAYDVIAMMDENYKDTYGDVNVEILFGTAYSHEKAMIILAGFPIEDAKEAPYVEWYVLRAEALEAAKGDVNDHAVEIGLKQLFLPWMEEKAIMLVVISEPLDQE